MTREAEPHRAVAERERDAGSAVVMIVVSRFCMKSAHATMSGTIIEFAGNLFTIAACLAHQGAKAKDGDRQRNAAMRRP